jgi:hypothetical protein
VCVRVCVCVSVFNDTLNCSDFIVSMIDELNIIEHWWSDIDKGRPNYSDKNICRDHFLPTTNPVWTGLDRTRFSVVRDWKLMACNLVVYWSVYKHNSFIIKWQLLFIITRHVSAKYSHPQANIDSKFRHIKCALNGIPLFLQYRSIYSYNKRAVVNLWPLKYSFLSANIV